MGIIMRIELRYLIGIYATLAVLPIIFHGNVVVLNLVIRCLIWGVVVAAWDLIMGYAGIFTFASVAFFVIGAYSSVISTDIFNISPWIGMILGGIITAIVGILVAFPCLKLKDAYIALVTFAVHMILGPLIKSDIGRAIGTGGTQGIFTIQPLNFGSYTFNSINPIPWYYTAYIISFISLYVIYRVIFSSWGLAFTAVRDSPIYAKCLGINDYKYKLIVFGVSAYLTGMIGAFYGHYTGVLSTRILGLDLFLILMVMLVVGGMGKYPGVFIGAFITLTFSELLRPLEQYRLIIFGATVVLAVLYLPNGVMGWILSDKSFDLYNNTINNMKKIIRSDTESGKIKIEKK